MRLHSIALMVLSLAACAPSPAAPPPQDPRGAAAATGGAPVSNPRRSETELGTRVSFYEGKPCDVPGATELAGQTEVRLTYVEWPHFVEQFCSNELAAHLRKLNVKEVPVTVSFDPKGQGHAICSIAGIEGKRLERGCSFTGVISGGFMSYGELGDPLSDAELPPWELRARSR